jgi:hypothetical protein
VEDGGGDTNIQAYVGNNPLMFADAFGLQTKSVSGKDSVTTTNFQDFLKFIEGKSLNKVNDNYNTSLPNDEYEGVRYVIDPLNSKKVIDMRHFFFFGQNGSGLGLLYELVQLVRQPLDHNDSAFHQEDLFSNSTGSQFFRNWYNRNKDQIENPDADPQYLHDQLAKFFGDSDLREWLDSHPDF